MGAGMFGPVSRYRSGIVGRYRYPPSRGGRGSWESLVTRQWPLSYHHSVR
jgi:hypothetical protein